MVKEQKLGKNTRMSFAKINELCEMPNLIDVQKESFQWFLDKGIKEVLHDISPITDHSEELCIEFVSYTLDVNKPKYPVEECKVRDVNYAAPLRVNVRLSNRMTGEVKEHEIFMGDFPLMTDNGTFVINGAERVVVSQIVRSPGMYYDYSIDKTGMHNYTAQVIPYRGAWLEYETDASNAFYVHIDKNRKMPVTVFIRALGVETAEEIKDMFGEKFMTPTLEKDESEKLAMEFGTSIQEEALKEIYKRHRPGEPANVESAKTLIHNYFFDGKRYDLYPVGRYKFNEKLAISKRILGLTLSRPVASQLTGEIICETGKVITKEDVEAIDANCVNEVYVIATEKETGNPVELKIFGNGTVDPKYLLGENWRDGLEDFGVSEKLHFENLMAIINECGGDRDAIIEKIKYSTEELCPKHITKEDILSSISYMIGLDYGIGKKDDIDHLGNRRLRCVGELLQNQLRIGMSRMEKIIRERLTTQSTEDLSPKTLVNIRPVATAIREFFGSSPLSQFMDQNNPLAEITHKRRISALGPGGLSRDRAGFEVRDVHYTHYGRMCPVETPEGPNIGLISYLSTYAKIDKYGFIEAPYRKIVDGIVTDEVVYLTADEEDGHVIAQAYEELDENRRFVKKKIIARERSEILETDSDRAEYMDVSPKMVVSVATAMIPFIENDDNARALMGSNMQKQAVPLLTSDSPIVGTGMEYKAAVDSGVVVLAKENGVVEEVDATHIVVKNEKGLKDRYELIKFKRSNQGNCVNQKPIVKVGESVIKGQVIADGPATSNGEISLGKNALIGFMTWEGYNYEDAVLLNEKLIRDDVYTSIHIEEYSQEARDTKLGPEEITREIPNVGEDALRNLDENGIVRIGTEVKAHSILVGKVTPKGETELTAEERLLRAIFGEKSRDVRDTSLRLKNGEAGIVVDVKVFSRENGDESLSPGVHKVVKVYVAQKRKISVGDKMAGRHGNKGVISRILPPEDMPYLADGTPLDIVLNPLGVPSRMNIGQVLEVHLGIAAKKLGWKIMTPVFDGAKEQDIFECLKMAGLWRKVLPNENTDGKDLFEEVVREDGKKDIQKLDKETRNNPEAIKKLYEEDKLRICDGKTILYDGRTGEPFDNPVTVGIMYYLKLHHLVDDKIHARSTGPYSLVTQQPLGGKAQFGGQRFGEMEVWALEAYGAAYTLQEILTVKSDDVLGRTKAFEAIVKGQNIPTPGVPESFKVLVKELQALALDITVLDKEGNEIELSNLGEDELEPMNIVVPAEEVADENSDEDLGEDFDSEEYEEEDADSYEEDGNFDDFDD
ncbi:MAG: DNA-directed RNA polymerase subunit beta [Clostridia bacterium]|nr:DNA-directed RNA polymerase subunit beta [Clostridia bacterium]